MPFHGKVHAPAWTLDVLENPEDGREVVLEYRSNNLTFSLEIDLKTVESLVEQLTGAVAWAKEAKASGEFDKVDDPRAFIVDVAPPSGPLT